MDEKRKELLKTIPKIDDIISLLEKRGIHGRASHDIVRDACRTVVQKFRERILNATGRELPAGLSDEQAADEAQKIIDDLHSYKLRQVVNATGVILHTNLGRAPLCPEAIERIVEVGRGYSNLEFDLARGERGLRYDHVGELICRLTGAPDALIVNNNAAAVLLVLNTLADGREAIVSRGELIEIGGEFRIPEVMAKSNSILREVGTTNRTRLSDYEKPSGLTRCDSEYTPAITGSWLYRRGDLVSLLWAKQHPRFRRSGSGCLVDLDRYGPSTNRRGGRCWQRCRCGHLQRRQA